MLRRKPFYHSHIKNTLVAFGSLFSDIEIKRESKDPEVESQTIKVPFTFSPKEKWAARLEQDPNLNNYLHSRLPIMGSEVVSYHYDNQRKVPKTQHITVVDFDAEDKTREVKRVYTPVPYNVDLMLYIISKGLEDGIQVLEQILPYFTPDYTVRMKTLRFNDTDLLEEDVPYILNGVSVQDEWEGSMENQRLVTHTLNFTAKIDIYGDISDTDVIYKTDTRMVPSLAELEDSELPKFRIHQSGIIGTGIVSIEGKVIGFDPDILPINYQVPNNNNKEGDIVHFEGIEGFGAVGKVSCVNAEGIIRDVEISNDNGGQNYNPNNPPLAIIDKRVKN